MVIVDTTVWVDYFRGARNPETDWLDIEMDRQRLGLTDIILCEVLQGVRDEATAQSVERQLSNSRSLILAGLTWRERPRRTFAPCGGAATRSGRRSTA